MSASDLNGSTSTGGSGSGSTNSSLHHDEMSPLNMTTQFATQSGASSSFYNAVTITHYENDDGGNGDDDVENNGNEDKSLFEFPRIHRGSIGMLGSVAIAVNSLTGPAMLNLPYTFQTSGFIPTIATLAFLCILSTFCALHLANVISKVPGNANFHKEIEYSETFKHFWGKNSFIFTQIAFFCCITCLNIASIVDTAQVVDQMLAKFYGGTIALQCKDTCSGSIYNTVFFYNWEVVHWNSSMCHIEEMKDEQEEDASAYHDDNKEYCIPFLFHNSTANASLNGDDVGISSWLITAGYILAGIILIPMSLKDLKENATFQIVGFVVLIIISLQFVCTFLMNGIHLNNVTLWGDDWSDLFGVCLFNFAVVLAVPAWLYEKKPSVSVTRALGGSSFLAFILYVLVGGLGAATMHNVTDNMLQSMMAGTFGNTTEITSMTFALFIVGLGIPLFSVLTRLNLTGSGLCTEFVANILAVYLPWTTAWCFYSGSGTTSLLGWGGIFFTSIVVFLAPLMLALHAISCFNSEGSVAVYGRLVLSKRQQSIALYVLIVFCVISIILAVIGELY
mmetsp:Transcript_15175/g.17333  ORF Transcript_15175/g.17333 Transcript_15175/m.17333 type:complete len:563 (-) Transcript_15175:254-1942(-)